MDSDSALKRRCGLKCLPTLLFLVAFYLTFESEQSDGCIDQHECQGRQQGSIAIDVDTAACSQSTRDLAQQWHFNQYTRLYVA
jgi:hypothetical protein